MFTVEQYRAKAIEYSKLLRIANGPNEVREYQRLERSFAELADNAQWVIDNHVVTDEETMIFVPAESGNASTVEMVTIDPQDLQAAQELDPNHGA
jgi:hypothetical protein